MRQGVGWRPRRARPHDSGIMYWLWQLAAGSPSLRLDKQRLRQRRNMAPSGEPGGGNRVQHTKEKDKAGGSGKGRYWSMHHCGVNTENWGERCRLESSKRAGFTLPAAGCGLLLLTMTHLPPPQLLLPCLVPRAPHRRRW